MAKTFRPGGRALLSPSRHLPFRGYTFEEIS